MDARPGGTDRHGPASRMRAGVAGAVRAGVTARGFTPAALASFLTAAAFTPLLVPVVGGAGGGEAAAALVQLGGIGGGYLATVLTGVIERTRRSAPEDAARAEERIHAELAEAIRQAIDAPGEEGAGMRSEVSAVLRRVDAIGAAMAADRDNILAPALAELGERFTEFHWVLGDLGTRLAEVQRTLVRQGVSQRSQILAARGELGTITGLLQRVIAAQEARASPADRQASQPGAPEAEPGDGAPGPRQMCPYPGLRPFESRDARWFFGRQELTAHLVGRLGEQLDAGSPLFVVGPSGAGKSSLLRAGLIPALRDGLLPATGSRRWPRVLVSQPGSRPLAALAEASAARAGSPADGLLAALNGDADAAAAALADRLLSGRPGSRLVLIVDQFEDIFTQCQDEEERLRFARVLLALARHGSPTASEGASGHEALVVVGVRADFYADCGRLDELRDLLPDNQLMIGPLSAGELRLAITRPAAAVGCAVEPGLTELLLSDLGLRPGGGASHEPGVLPLLAYSLRATWDRREARTLTVAGYQKAGGVHGAIANEAERIYQDFPPEAQQVVRRVMLRLVSVHTGTGTQQARQLVTRDDLLAGLNTAAAQAVLTRFTQARLVSASAEGVQITHDAFLDAWPRLREWIAEDLAGLRTHRQIAGDAQSWAGVGRDPGSLYRGVRLGNAQNWRSAGDNEADLSDLEREFLGASAAAEEAERAALEQRRLRERRQNRRLRTLAGGLAVVLAGALVAAGIAVGNGRAASARGHQAQADVFALQSEKALSTSLVQTDLLALAAWQESHTVDARSSLLSRQADPYAGSFPMRSSYLVPSVALSPDGRLLAAGGQPGFTGFARSSVWLWDLATRRRLAVFSGLNGLVKDLSFSPNGATLAALVLGHPHSLHLWNVTTRKAEPNPTGDTGRLSALAYSPDGRMLAIAQGPSHVIDLWSLAGHRLVGRLAGSAGTVWSLAFSPDGKLLVSGGADNTLRLWNVATATKRDLLRVGGFVTSVAFSPDGRLVASAGRDGAVWVWDLATGVARERYLFTGGATPLIAFGREGRYLYALDGGPDQLSTFDLFRRLTISAVTPGAQPSVISMAGSSRGATLALGGENGLVLMVDESQGAYFEPANASLFSLAISPRGHLAATSAGDGTVQLWDPARPQAPARLLPDGHLDLGPAAFSPDGKTLATAGPGASVALWNVATGTRQAVPLPAQSCANDSAENLAFSPDGKTLAAYTLGDTIALWDIPGRRWRAVLQRCLSPALAYSGMAYSPDGRTFAYDSPTGIVLRDTRTGRVTGRLPGRGGPTKLAFSPDGKLLAEGTGFGTTSGPSPGVNLWTVATRKLAGTMGPFPSAVRSLAFSPDGGTLAVVSRDNSVRLWDVASRQLVATLSGHTSQVNDAAFTQDGRTLITSSADGTARIWDLNPADEVRALCAALRGPAFNAEWRALTPSPGPDPCG